MPSITTAVPAPDSEQPSLSQAAPSAPRLFRGMRVVSAMTLLSRVFGLVRDIGMAGLFGLSPLMDAFTFAFRIPNLFRKMFGDGASTTAFLPVLARELEHPDRLAAWKLTRAVCTVLTLFLCSATLVAEIAICLASHLSGITADTRILLGFLAVFLPYVVLICVASQIGAVLNALGSFSWPASIPALLNLVWIAGVFWLAPWFKDPVDQALAIAWCILATGVLQVLMQLPILCQLGYRYSSAWRDSMPQVWEISRVMIPVVLGLSITQFNTFNDSLIAWSFTQPPNVENAVMPLPGGPAYPLRTGAITALSYGERMYQFPLGVFGVALGTVLYPLLARHAARGEFDRLRDDLALGLRLVIVICVPASAGLMILAHPLARALFEHGKFDLADTVRTARIIATYGSGVWAYCALLILQRGYYALGDRMTPLRIGMMSVGVNLIGNLVLIWPFAESGLAFSTVLCAVLQVALLIFGLQQRIGSLPWKALISTTVRTVGATGVMSAAGIATSTLSAGLSGRLPGLVLPCLTASLTYLLCAKLCGLDELWILFQRERNPEPVPRGK